MNRCFFNGIHEIASLVQGQPESLRAFIFDETSCCPVNASTYSKMDFSI